MSIREEILSLNEVFKLKETYRFSQVQDRKESSAEHSWSCLIVADYLLGYVKRDLDRLRVYELLMYHDLVEAECGDVALTDKKGRINKQAIEQRAVKQLASRLPSLVSKKLLSYFEEYTQASTPEAVFAHLVDGFESDAFYGMYPPRKAVVSSQEYDAKRAGAFKLFPELQEHYDQLKLLRVEEGIVLD